MYTATLLSTVILTWSIYLTIRLNLNTNITQCNNIRQIYNIWSIVVKAPSGIFTAIVIPLHCIAFYSKKSDKTKTSNRK